jgi:D-xylulose reductase
VAKAYGVKTVVMFDAEESRTQFAKSYGADVALVPPRIADQDSLTFATDYAREIITTYDLGAGFDVTVEASGAEICAQMAICMLKSGGTCTLPPSKPRFVPIMVFQFAVTNIHKGIQAGLGKPLTAVPLFMLTAKELNIKGEKRLRQVRDNVGPGQLTDWIH